MITTSTELFDLYHRVANLTEAINDPVLMQNFAEVAHVFADKEADFNIKVMMYGVYNAGKSTLINALLGENLAAVGDVPMTERIEQYQWKNYTIFDTPGIDAPKAHEIVTEAQLRTVDGIIFVVNPQGVVEERKTLEVLVALLADRRKVFLVFNEKQKLSDEDFMKLKDAVRIRIQEIAAARGLHNILKEIPILRINAKLALKARTEDPRFLEYSGYNQLAAELNHFLAGISHQDLLNRLVTVLRNYIASALNELNNEENEAIIQNYNQLLQRLSTEYHQATERLQSLIVQEGSAVQRQSKLLLQRDPKNCEAAITRLLEESVTHFISAMGKEAQHLALRFQGEIEELEQMIIDSSKLSVQLKDLNVMSENRSESSLMEDEKRPESEGLINPQNINSAVQTVARVTKPEHIVAGLKVVKEWLPSLMTGVGSKTMEKWAGAIVGRWIPFVGTAVTVLTSVWDAFGNDAEDQQVARAVAQQQAEEERYRQQVEDVSTEIMINFKRDCTRYIMEHFDPWFNELVEKLKATQGSVSRQKAANQNFIFELEQINLALID